MQDAIDIIENVFLGEFGRVGFSKLGEDGIGNVVFAGVVSRRGGEKSNFC